MNTKHISEQKFICWKNMAQMKKEINCRPKKINSMLKIGTVDEKDPHLKLSLEMIEFYEKISLSEKEVRTRTYIFDRIKQIIMENFKCEISSFGSFRTGLMVHDSDIDITVIKKLDSEKKKKKSISMNDSPKKITIRDVEETLVKYNIKKENESENPAVGWKTEVNHLLEDIKKVLQRNMKKTHILHIRKAKTPILRFKENEYGYKIDISINQESGIEAANYIVKVIEKIPDIKYPVLIFKYFLKQRGLADAAMGGLCSYGQFLMWGSYLKNHPIVGPGDIKKNLGMLFVDFLQFYGNDFHYKKIGIDDDGGYLHAENFTIMDPVTPNNNVVSGCTSVEMVKEVFSHSFNIMKAALMQNIDRERSLIVLWVRINIREQKERLEIQKRHLVL